ncbi:hypothetical protein ACQUQP_11435 [Marinobacterium sp. YM272]|uniref:hypothetical protein n=1 Tax=Marinobacterium sp. YM272 TaxID=3421654 RepID=UPI003D7FB87F
MKKLITLLTTLLFLLAGFTTGPAVADRSSAPRVEVVSAVHSSCSQQLSKCPRICAVQPLSVSSTPETIWREDLILPAGFDVAATRPGFTTQPTPPPRA